MCKAFQIKGFSFDKSMNRLKGPNQKGENLAKFSNEVKDDLICKHHDYNSLSRLIIYAYISINVICYSYFWCFM